MKKSSVLFVSVLALGMTFSSCSKDDNSSGPIEGKWNFNKISYTQSGYTSTEEDYFDNQEGCNKDYFEFRADGVYNMGDYHDTDCNLYISTGTWVKNGNTITISFPDEENLVFKIKSVSGTVLKIKQNVIDEEEGTTYSVNLTLNKS